MSPFIYHMQMLKLMSVIFTILTLTVTVQITQTYYQVYASAPIETESSENQSEDTPSQSMDEEINEKLCLTKNISYKLVPSNYGLQVPTLLITKISSYHSQIFMPPDRIA